MRCRCAAVSVTLLAVLDVSCALPLSLDEQPASAHSQPMAQEHAKHFIVRMRRSLPIGLLRQFLPVPPAAAQRLEQRGGVRITIGLCLYQRDARLLPSLLRVRQRELVDVAIAQ